MPYEIIMPKLGLTMKAGTIVQWLKREGDAVSEKEPVIEIETEKLNYSIESPANGVVLKKLANEGEKYAIACVLGYVGNEGEDLPANAMITAVPFTDTSKPSNLNNTAAPAARIYGERVFITPVARKLATEQGIDYRQIPGTGPNGRIVKADVLRFSEHQMISQDTQSIDVVVPYAGIRRSIGENMRAAWNTSPMVTYQVSVDVSELVAFRAMINNGVVEKTERVSINDLLLKLTATALRAMPAMNATIADAGIIRHNRINLGMATAIKNGLVVPVIHDADSKTLLSISREAKDFATRARNGSLMPDEMHGGTFTVTNLGAYNSVDFFTPIINPPEAAILGVGRIVQSAVVISGEVKIRSMLGLSLTCDHRAIDGAVAADFMQVLMRLLENPVRAVM